MAIDMSKSGWENPEGFGPRERTEQAPPEVKVCEVVGPDGWVCDLPPNHGGDMHVADGGPSWPRTGARPEPAPSSQDWAQIPPAWDEVTSQVREISLKALAAQSPAAWAVALSKIEELTRVY